MSDAEEQQPAGQQRRTEGDAPDADADAWATATEEDLAAEQARRRERYGSPPPDPAEELRRLADAVTQRIARLPGGLGLGAAPLAAQARARIEPVIERNAEVFQHLAAAGQELLAAYRSAVEGQERTWTRVDRPDRPEQPRPAREADAEDRDVPDHRDDSRDDSPGQDGPHRIDLD
ncbi:DUF5304 family protein [Streptomyces sp. B6B3]|uniref:DUF5304 family protein n=1 Tax=Streptomyces sp. B6B3 TaxID=3153570 RepID=UPI00325EBEC5